MEANILTQLETRLKFYEQRVEQLSSVIATVKEFGLDKDDTQSLIPPVGIEIVATTQTKGRYRPGSRRQTPEVKKRISESRKAAWESKTPAERKKISDARKATWAAKKKALARSISPRKVA